MKLESMEFPKLDQQDYDEQLTDLQLALMHAQHGVVQSNRRVIILFEGIDAAGKGGTIDRIVNYMDPHHYRVNAIRAPTPTELNKHYLQRFMEKLPSKGNITIFDRSWYGRVLVERVEGLTPKPDWERAYNELNHFERMLTADGIIFLKFFLFIEKDEQRKRFIKRLDNPEKRWKITRADIDSRAFWDEYILAFEDMLKLTSTEYAPWHVIPANNKKHARITVMQTILKTLQAEIDVDVRLLDPKFEAYARQMLKNTND
ncbi:Polyphosphate:AMP phosphotransferase [BD1-7 clade bacterium]|uniref:Polyphosphate:AMP phosphotransferase n=1 Tax=BD1-7 clade bacterium TaxID=2029982 RepID=A0A5S9PM04_9GAMM|nr:Polyphosphate:AMP phosphotransferase [BD1-7 clade bacterium]CAA0104979.1 Polyphosphate:AMP phosphotransferase [BD1-7 clade bacterium]